MFIMTTVLDLLQTTKCSGFLGSRITLFTVMSVPAVLPSDLKVLQHSVVFIFQTFEKNRKKISTDKNKTLHVILTISLLPR